MVSIAAWQSEVTLEAQLGPQLTGFPLQAHTHWL